MTGFLPCRITWRAVAGRARRLAAPWLAALACVIAAPAPAAGGAGGDDGRSTAPVAIGSPAWEALMDLPWRDRDALHLAVPALLCDWHQPELADRLQSAMLLAQLRMAAGLQPLPAETARVGGSWRPDDPPVDVDDLQEAWRVALVRGLDVTPAKTPPPPMGAREAGALPGLPGFWRVDDEGHVAVMARLDNRSPMRLSPGSSGARLTWRGA